MAAMISGGSDGPIPGEDAPWGMLHLVVPGHPAATNASSMPTVIPLQKRRILLGRVPGNDVVLENDCVSGTHCCLSFVLPSVNASTAAAAAAAGQVPAGSSAARGAPIVSLADCSSNGCFVNDRKLGKGIIYSPLETGDIVHLVRTAPPKTTKYNLAFRFERVLPLPPVAPGGGGTASTDDVAVAPLLVAPPMPAGTAGHVLPLLPTSFLGQASLRFGELELPAVPPGQAKHISVEPSAVSSDGTNDDDGATDADGAAAEAASSGAPLVIAGNIEDYYVLDRDRVLGAGSFAPVYAASVKAPPLLAPHGSGTATAAAPYAVKVVEQKAFVYADQFAEMKRNFPRRRPVIERAFSASAGGPGVPDALIQLLPAAVSGTKRFRDPTRALATGVYSAHVVEAVQAVVRELNDGPEDLRVLVMRELRCTRRQRCEVTVLACMRHPHIIRLHRVIETPASVSAPATLAIVMDLAQGGELATLVLNQYGALPEFLTKIVIFQILSAVRYFHGLGIAHRDIKLENVLLREPFNVEALCTAQTAGFEAAKAAAAAASNSRKRDRSPDVPAAANAAAAPLCAAPHRLFLQQRVYAPPAVWPHVLVSDFGLAFQSAASLSDAVDQPAILNANDPSDPPPLQTMDTQCGTPMYAAPEVTNRASRSDPRGGYTTAVDLYSVGVAAFAMLLHRQPYPPVHPSGGGAKSSSRLNYNPNLLAWGRHIVDRPASAAAGCPVLFCSSTVADAPISAAGRALITRLLAPREAERPSAAEALQHEWFAELRQ